MQPALTHGRATQGAACFVSPFWERGNQSANVLQGVRLGQGCHHGCPADPGFLQCGAVLA